MAGRVGEEQELHNLFYAPTKKHKGWEAIFDQFVQIILVIILKTPLSMFFTIILTLCRALELWHKEQPSSMFCRAYFLVQDSWF